MDGNKSKVITIFAVLVIITFVAVAGMFALLKDSDSSADSNSSLLAADAYKSVGITGGSYIDYSPETVTYANDGDVVLLFKTSWCSTCTGLEQDIEAKLADIPKSLVIAGVDFDTDKELRKKYGVTVQHTLVQVDKDGKLIKKWVGSPTLEEVVKNIV